MSNFETLTIIGGGGPTPVGWKIYLGDKDISRSVKGLKISSFVHEVVKVELCLMVEVDRIEIAHLKLVNPSDAIKKALEDANAT